MPTADEETMSQEEPEPGSGLESQHDGLRRRAAYLYGLIVCGTVLAAEPEDIKAWLVGVALVAVQVALLVTVALLAVVGWVMSPTERSSSPRRLGYAVFTVALGVVMIELKNAVHH